MSNTSPVSPFGDYSGPPPVLIAATSPEARARAERTIDATGHRTAAVEIGEAIERLSIQAAASAFWVEVDRDGGVELDRLLDRIDAEAGSGRFPAIIVAPAALIDPISARIHDSSVQLLVDPAPADRVAALALATARRHEGARVQDVASEGSAARLRQLSDEVSRIAATLARLSVAPGAPAANRNEPVGEGEVPAVSLETIRQVIRARRLRARFFDEELFADPAWDMLLDLLQAEFPSIAFPYLPCASPRPSRRRPRFAGSRR